MKCYHYTKHPGCGKAAEQHQPKIFCSILNNEVALSDDLFILASDACYWPYCWVVASKRRVKSQCPWIEIQEGWVALCHDWLSNCIEDVDLVLSMWCQRTSVGMRRCLWQIRHAEFAQNKSENSGSLQMTSGWKLDRSKRYFAGLQTLRLRCRGCNVFFSFFTLFQRELQTHLYTTW